MRSPPSSSCRAGSTRGEGGWRAMKKRRWWQLRRSRRAQRWALAAVVITLVTAVWFARTAWDRLISYPERPAPGTSDPIEIVVPQGASFPEVLALLVDNGVVPE